MMDAIEQADIGMDAIEADLNRPLPTDHYRGAAIIAAYIAQAKSRPLTHWQRGTIAIMDQETTE